MVINIINVIERVHPKMRDAYRAFIAERRAAEGVDFDSLPPEARPYMEGMELGRFIDRGTGIFNHETFPGLLERQLLELREGHVGGVLVGMTDVNGLKIINDMWGHSEGDLAINIAADGLLDSTRSAESPGYQHRPFDHVGRGSRGDEFFMVTRNDIDGHGSIVLVSRIPLNVSRVDRQYESRKGGNYEVSVSSGGAFTDKYMGMGELIKRADEAMYTVKRSGDGARSAALWTPEGGTEVYRWGQNGCLYSSGHMVRDANRGLVRTESVIPAYHR